MKEAVFKDSKTNYLFLTLKTIALVTMTMDHLAVRLDMMARIDWDTYDLMRCFGRFSFPLFCLILSFGFFHTGNIKKYLLRMLIFALISELPYDLCIHNSIIDLNHQNVIFTLFFGLVCLKLIDDILTNNKIFMFKIDPQNFVGKYILVIPVVTFFCASAYLFKSEYRYEGIILIVIVYFLLSLKYTTIKIKADNEGDEELYSEKNSNNMNLWWKKILKNCFYYYYPVHLIILYLLFSR